MRARVTVRFTVMESLGYRAAAWRTAWPTQVRAGQVRPGEALIGEIAEDHHRRKARKAGDQTDPRRDIGRRSPDNRRRCGSR